MGEKRGEIKRVRMGGGVGLRGELLQTHSF